MRLRRHGADGGLLGGELGRPGARAATWPGSSRGRRRGWPGRAATSFTRATVLGGVGVAGRPVVPQPVDEREVVHLHDDVGERVLEEEHVPGPLQLPVGEEALGDGAGRRHRHRHDPAPALGREGGGAVGGAGAPVVADDARRRRRRRAPRGARWRRGRARRSGSGRRPARRSARSRAATAPRRGSRRRRARAAGGATSAPSRGSRAGRRPAARRRRRRGRRPRGRSTVTVSWRSSMRRNRRRPARAGAAGGDASSHRLRRRVSTADARGTVAATQGGTRCST